ncbi:keratin, type I cytoskeletal 9-like [Panthera pardus]|uniref:Keratin, type I cytoskeletal 9-like n=1 Tax=Panthera pardus TaxID=9691 RepID=A0A9W2V0G1_PANPR|nr:keratin, type I cytoskeletal 9-like [Panthera pardus]
MAQKGGARVVPHSWSESSGGDMAAAERSRRTWRVSGAITLERSARVRAVGLPGGLRRLPGRGPRVPRGSPARSPRGRSRLDRTPDSRQAARALGPDSGSLRAARRRTRTGLAETPPGGGSGEARGRGRRRGVALVTGGRAAAAHWAGGGGGFGGGSGGFGSCGGGGAGRGPSRLLLPLLLLLRWRLRRESRGELGCGAQAGMKGCGGAAREQPAGESAGGGRRGPGRWRRGRRCGPRPASPRSGPAASERADGAAAGAGRGGSGFADLASAARQAGAPRGAALLELEFSRLLPGCGSGVGGGRVFRVEGYE